MKSSLDITRLLDLHSHNPVLVCGKETILFHDVPAHLKYYINYFKKTGIKPGQRIGIFGENSIPYVLSILSLMAIGAVAVPVSTRLPEKELRSILLRVNAGLVLTDYHDFLPGPVIFYRFPGKPVNATADIGNNISGLNPIPLSREATILFTSGSTGTPKAVLHTLGNHYYSAAGSNEFLTFVAGDSWLLTLPLYHVGGLSLIFRALLGGGAVIIPEKRGGIKEALIQHRPSHISLVPTQLIRLADDPETCALLKQLKVILLGGAPAVKDLLDRIKEEQLPVYLTYGSTEAASQVYTTYNISSPAFQQKGGSALPYREMKIDDTGEILIRGNTICKGYAEGDITGPVTEGDGWYHSGDTGIFDGNGLLHITGRIDNMFISGGENIYPEEIERALCAVPGIRSAVVVPVADGEFGQRPVAFLQRNEGSDISSGDIAGIISSKLPKYKIPDKFYEWPDISVDEGVKLRREVFRRYLKRTDLPFFS